MPLVYAAMLSQTLLSAGTFLVAKAALDAFAPTELAWLRFATAALGYLLLLRATGRRLLPPRALRSQVALLAVLGVVLNQGLFLSGLALSTPTHGAILYALTPACVLILERVLAQQALRPRKVLGTAIAFAGAILVLLQRDPGLKEASLVGDLLILAAVLLWSTYTVLARSAVQRHGVLAVTGWAGVVGSLLVLPCAPLVLRPLPAWADVGLPAWGGLLYLGWVTSVLAYLLWSYALRRLESAQVAVFSNLQPVCTGLLSWAIFGERLTPALIAGCLLVIAGVSLVQRRRRPGGATDASRRGRG